MAAGDAARHGDRLSGLILMGADLAGNVNLREARLRVLSLLAERDGVASAGEVRGGLRGTRLTLLPGAVHAFFGRYGPQRGDGQPTMNRATTEAQVVRAAKELMATP
ncbi:alpha/beta hydrolase [Deinococcus aestuarii]|uniref:alpha/beta hydrolase n=1 Tax=Deinococcus aestuarii TaxID=2774531 RepID=UPI0031B7F4DF